MPMNTLLLSVDKFHACSLFILSYFGDYMKYPALMGHLSNFRALIPRPFNPTGCHLFNNRKAFLFGKSSLSVLLFYFQALLYIRSNGVVVS